MNVCTNFNFAVANDALHTGLCDGLLKHDREAVIFY